MNVRLLIYQRHAGLSVAATSLEYVKPGLPLDARARELLAFESQWFRHLGEKERQVRELFGVSMVRYWQEVNAILDDPRALEFDPINVGRLRRIREARKR